MLNLFNLALRHSIVEEAPAAPATPEDVVTPSLESVSSDIPVTDEDLGIFETIDKATRARAEKAAEPVVKPAPVAAKAPEPPVKPAEPAKPAVTPKPDEPSVVKAAPPFPQDKLPAEVTPAAPAVVPEAAKPAEVAKPPEVKPEPVQPKTQEDRQKWKAALRAELEKQYVIPEEDAAQFLTAPEKVLPKYAAQLHTEIFEAIFHGIMAVMPNILEQWNAAGEVRRAAEEKFFGSWPDLRAHKDLVARMADVYKRTYPSVTQEDIIKEVGSAAMIRLGLAKPAVPLAPVVPTAPFRPAVTGAAPAQPARKGENVFENLAEEFIEEDAR